MKEKNWKLTLFTWLYRVFCYLVPGGYALYAFLIDTLISEQTSVWDKVSCSAIFVVALMVIIAVFFYGRHLKKKINDITNQCIECVDNVQKADLVAQKKKWEAKQEMFRNACFVAPFIIAWFIVAMIEKQVVSLRGTLMVVSISMCAGLGFNGIAQWIKCKSNKEKDNAKAK